jgi:hypothetical protein
MAVSGPGSVHRVEDFLGLPHATYPQDFLNHRRNANKQQLAVCGDAWHKLSDFYRPHNEWLQRLFPYANLSSWDAVPE